MSCDPYIRGTRVRCFAAFENDAGAAADPTTVIFKVIPPSGVANIVTKTYPTDIEVVKDSTGNYHLDVDATIVGEWEYRYEGTGTVITAGEGKFLVEDTPFP